MGDPKFPRKKYRTPSHPWEAERIAEEHELVKKYGLKNKREIWKAQTFLEGFRRQSMNLTARLRTKDPQAEKESEWLLKRMQKLGLLDENATLDAILGLTVEDVLNRRLQTIVYMKGLASTPKQARQLIVHGHIAIKGRRITIPGHIVTVDEEPYITYYPYSPLADELHPARPQARREVST